MRATSMVSIFSSGAALFISACTAGQIIDSNNNPMPVGANTEVNFYPVDSSGHSTGPTITMHTGTEYNGSIFSFDPYGPNTSNNNGTIVDGVANDATDIPPGDYWVSVYPTNVTAGSIYTYYTSPIFHHQFYQTCTDHFTNKSVNCAQYELKMYNEYSWDEVDGSLNEIPPTESDGGNRVIPFLMGYSNPTYEGSLLYNNW